MNTTEDGNYGATPTSARHGAKPNRPGAGQQARQQTAGADRGHWWVLVVLALSQLMVVLDGTIVNIALPTAQRDLAFSDDNRQWLVTGYALAFGSLLLLGGRLADFFGRRRLLVIGLSGFAVASAIGGLTDTFTALLVARILQGAFGALLAPAALSLLSTTFPGGPERAKAFAIFGAVSSAGGAVGLLLGGVLTEYLSWRACLFVNFPLAIIVLLGSTLMYEGQRPSRPRLDVLGLITAVLGLVGLVYGLATAEQHGWAAAVTWGPIAAGVAFLVLFVLVEQHVHEPLMPLHVVLDRTRGGALIVGMLANAALFGVFLFGTYFMAGALGFNALQTGLAFVPVVVTIIVGTAVAGSAFGARMGPQRVMGVGGLIAAGGVASFSRCDASSSYAGDLLPALLILGFGLGLIYARLQDAATADVGGEDVGVASALINTSQQIGGSIGTAVLSSVSASAAAALLVTTRGADAALAASIAGFHAVSWGAAFIFVVCATAALLLRSGPLKRNTEAVPL